MDEPRAATRVALRRRGEVSVHGRAVGLHAAIDAHRPGGGCGNGLSSAAVWEREEAPWRA